MNYYVKRISMAVVTFIAAATIAFVLYRVMPGSPIEKYKAQLIREAMMENKRLTRADIERIDNRVNRFLNVDPEESILQAYFEYVRDIVLYQDFGESYWQTNPSGVFEILFNAMPWSVFVSIYGLLIGFTINIFVGALMGYKEGSKFDYGMTITGMILGAIPYYVVALLMILVFTFELGWLPNKNRYDPGTSPGFNLDFMVGVVRHGLMPIGSGVIFAWTGSLAMRANSIKELGSDYIRSARLRGIGTTRMTTRYVGRNAILPMYTGLMIGISGIFSSNVIMERIFQYKGVGWMLFGALLEKDYPLLQGSFIFFAGITIVGILLADFTYGLIDPRVQTGAEREEY